MPASQVNERLADAMRQAAMSNKALARAVQDLSGGAIGCDHTSVSRWLSGTTPRGRTAGLIADALGTKLRRTVSLEEIGLSRGETDDATLGTRYADTPAVAAQTLGRLWRADLSDVRAVLAAPPDGSAWAEASLGWLVRERPDSLVVRSSAARVGLSDVEALRTTVEMFAQLDNRFGGAHARRSLVQFLQTEASSLLDASFAEATGRQLYSAAAEGTLLAAWMSYDAGLHGMAQRYFVQALRMAHAAEDDLLAGSILDAMSHQATFLGRHREAANLARAARTGTRGKGTATLTAHFHAMEARALAAGGDAVGAQRALSDAASVFERRRPGSDPEWFGYFDEAELAAEFGHCFRDIRRSDDGAAYAQQALTGAGASARSDFFVTMVLAASQLQRGDVDEACSTAQAALQLGVQLKSARCAKYLADFRASLATYAKLPTVMSLAEAAGDHPLWLASSPD